VGRTSSLPGSLKNEQPSSIKRPASPARDQFLRTLKSEAHQAADEVRVGPENSKFECRNSKQIQTGRIPVFPTFPDFRFQISFEFRISDFQFSIAATE
jgi:hypothetical protein